MNNKPMQETQARAFLNRLRVIVRRLNAKREQVQALREMAAHANAQLSGMPRSASPNLQRLETLVCKIADLEAEIQQEALDMEDVYKRQALLMEMGTGKTLTTIAIIGTLWQEVRIQRLLEIGRAHV